MQKKSTRCVQLFLTLKNISGFLNVFQFYEYLQRIFAKYLNENYFGIFHVLMTK